ncbi:host attachment family protein [Aurantimonas marina]|uniref:host attachment family protein n=1 Tax=Aurantimonas marina TaxID=2780508 RepID=UPI0019D04E0B|nr:host attachment protein [Aurantimonas marina]
MILPNGAIVAVADGTTLKLFRNKGVETRLDLVFFDDPAVAPVNPSSGSRHRSDSANPDRGRPAEDGFAAASAEYLNRLAVGGALDHLFLIADPRTLGEMRKHFHAKLQGKIVGELPKDLVGHPVDDIATAIRHA